MDLCGFSGDHLAECQQATALCIRCQWATDPHDIYEMAGRPLIRRPNEVLKSAELAIQT